jgi:protein tyrosine/serine phosphatase
MASKPKPPRHDLTTRWGRFEANARLLLKDHGFLRVPWTHMYELAPGVWRSNQPSPKRLAELKRRGFRSVVSLRGAGHTAPTLLEREACARLGLAFHKVTIGGGRAAPRERLLRLLDIFRVIEKPFVIHCKSGIDRTGLAAFLYLLAETDTPPEIAREQLSFKYLHLKTSRHGILDLMADSYIEDWRRTGIGIRDWIATRYDRDALESAYRGRA